MVLGNIVVFSPGAGKLTLNGFIFSQVCAGKKGTNDVEEATEIKYHLFSDISVLTALNEHLLKIVGSPFTHSPIYSVDIYWVPEITGTAPGLGYDE